MHHAPYATHHTDNDLEVLVISDTDTDKAAAAMSVGSGSWSDPTNRPGLAHFCEHMLFLGTRSACAHC